MSALPWFRLYAEFADDPKVQVLSEALQRRFIMLLCMQCAGQLEISPTHTVEDVFREVAFKLRIPDTDLAETRAEFERRGLLKAASFTPRKWAERQFVSDSSASRVKKYRNKRRELGLTSNGYTKHSETVMRRDCHRCVYCGSTEKLCLDHVLPVTLGGTDDQENLVTACKGCNSGKAGRTPENAGYSWVNKEAEKRWIEWMSRRVTVSVTPSESEQSRTEQKDPPSPPVGGKRAKRADDASRGTRLPQPFNVTPEMRAWLTTECPNVKLEAATREFCDYWRGVPGNRGKKLDWPATWRNRMREVEARARRFAGAGAALNQTGSADAERERLDKLKDRRPVIGLADFRDPNPGENSDAYLAAQNAEWNARQPKDRTDLARKPPVAATPERPALSSVVATLSEAKKIA